MSSFIRFLTEVGFPIAGALSGGVFIFIILKFILNGVKGGVAGLGGMIGSLQNRVDVMTNEKKYYIRYISYFNRFIVLSFK